MILKKLTGITLLFAVFFMACKKENPSTFIKEKISGVSQKGPFLNGSSLTVFELDPTFSQTGKSFITQILDNLGSFEIENLNLATPYTKLKADGFYFNEVKNANSISPISLYALSDLSNKNKVNINLLSTLEASRAEYLINNGASFYDAKHQAQQEVLNMFFIHKPSIGESESLNISINGDDNAILLAISLILQGYRTEAELSQLLGDISTDIRTDGILNSAALGSDLINDAKLLNLPQIRNNIENKYISLGVTTVIPHFEQYITQFIDSCTYTFTDYITYPTSSGFGINILNSTDSIFTGTNNGIYYCANANIPNGGQLKVRFDTEHLGYFFGSMDGWTDLGVDSLNFRTWESNRAGLINLHCLFFISGNFPIYIYENSSVTPTRVKNIVYVQ